MFGTGTSTEYGSLRDDHGSDIAHCDGWTSNDLNRRAHQGTAHETNSNWISCGSDCGTAYCDNERALRCVCQY